MRRPREQLSHPDGHGAVGRTDGSVAAVIHHFAGPLVMAGHLKP